MPSPPRVKNVLVVDDSATMRRMIIASLAPIGELSFEQAVSGLEAIERITLSRIDLVMLDLNMPDVHGLEVTATTPRVRPTGGVAFEIVVSVREGSPPPPDHGAPTGCPGTSGSHRDR